MNTHNIRFYGEISKIVAKLSSSTLLICFSDTFMEELTRPVPHEPLTTNIGFCLGLFSFQFCRPDKLTLFQRKT